MRYLLVALLFVAGIPAPAQNPWRVIWSDEFDVERVPHSGIGPGVFHERRIVPQAPPESERSYAGRRGLLAG